MASLGSEGGITYTNSEYANSEYARDGSSRNDGEPEAAAAGFPGAWRPMNPPSRALSRLPPVAAYSRVGRLRGQ